MGQRRINVSDSRAGGRHCRWCGHSINSYADEWRSGAVMRKECEVGSIRNNEDRRLFEVFCYKDERNRTVPEGEGVKEYCCCCC